MTRRRPAGGHRAPSAWGLRLVMVLALLGSARSADAYLKFGLVVNGRSVTLHWTSIPVRYRVSEQSVPGVTAAEFRDAVGRAFTSWEAVPTAAIRYQFGGFTDLRPFEDDGQSVVGFANRPDLDRVLASTSLLIDEVTGELVESDIFFNTAFPWTVAVGGDPRAFDLETIALHEIGHFSGLGHSALGETEIGDTGRRVTSAEAVMFPIAFSPGSTANRVLKADDVAGISDLYPEEAFAAATGSVSGRVTLNGAGIFGAHVVAFNPRTGALVGGFTLNQQGQFSIGGLRPGVHLLRVEPLDDADVGSFFDELLPVSLDFKVVMHPRLVSVPKGGDSGAVDVPVTSK